MVKIGGQIAFFAAFEVKFLDKYNEKVKHAPETTSSGRIFPLKDTFEDEPNSIWPLYMIKEQNAQKECKVIFLSPRLLTLVRKGSEIIIHLGNVK